MKNPLRIIVLLVQCVGFVASVHAQPRSITNQLVVHLTFDNTLNDNSGRGNNATYNSANGLVTNPLAPTYVAGKIGQAFEFTTALDASRIDFASLGYPDDLKFRDTNDWSVAFWIYNTNNVGDPAFIANKNWFASANPGWGIFAQNGGNFRVQMTDSVTTSLRIAGTRPNVVRDGSWHHIVVTLKVGGTRNIYFDGALNDSAANPITGGTDTDDLLNGLGLPYAVNIGEDGTGGYNDSTANPPPALPTGGDSAIYNAAIDDVGFWRRVLTDIEVSAVYSFGQLGTNLYNVPDVRTPIVLSFNPLNGSTTVDPNIPTTAAILDQDTQLNTNSVQLLVDGLLMAHTLTKIGTTNFITYTQPFLSAPSTTHTNKLIFADNGIPTRKTNVNVFTIASWTNVYLPAPLYSEDFDQLPLATNGPPTVFPAGWTATNCTDPAAVVGWDLYDERSDAYMDWVITTMDIAVNNTGWGANILNVNGPIVVNGALVTVLGSNKVAFAASDRRSGSQIQIMLTGDYNLTGQSNVYVAFNSMYTQNQDNIDSLEYSIDQGATWLPIVYLLNSAADDIIITNGVIDAYATLTTIHSDAAFCTGSGDGNYYGAFIGVASNLWGTLGPYFSARIDDNQKESHRLEKYRLSQADGQPKVRFRFMQAATDSWVWAVDNFGIYSIPSPAPLQIGSFTRSGTNITINWNGIGGNFSGLQKTTNLSPANWVNIPGTIGQTNYAEPIGGNTAYYRGVRF